MSSEQDSGNPNIVENTSRRPPEAHLAGSIVASPSRYITDMENAGQQQLLASDLLPVDAGRIGEQDGWEVLQQWGITRGEPTPGDELFVAATLPNGWTRQPAEDDRFSYIVDATGARRAEIFYKAAFYDRRAYLRIIEP